PSTFHSFPTRRSSDLSESRNSSLRTVHIPIILPFLSCFQKLLWIYKSNQYLPFHQGVSLWSSLIRNNSIVFLVQTIVLERSLFQLLMDRKGQIKYLYLQLPYFLLN